MYYVPLENRKSSCRAACFDSSIKTAHATFVGDGAGEEQGCWECFKHFYRVFCMCWDRNYQDLHSDWVFFKGRQLAPVFAEVVVDNKEGRFPSDHYPVYIEFLLPRSVRLVEGSLVV